MFSLEREIDVPIIPTRVLYERAYEWLRTIDSVPAKVYDDQLHPIGHRSDWVRRSCNLRYLGKDYFTNYTLSLYLVPTGDGKCTVRLYRPLVSAYCGRRTILTVDDLPIVYGGYNKGMFGATRNKEVRIFICDEVNCSLFCRNWNIITFSPSINCRNH